MLRSLPSLFKVFFKVVESRTSLSNSTEDRGLKTVFTLAMIPDILFLMVAIKKRGVI